MFWGLYGILELLTEYVLQIELQIEESALLMLLFIGFANTNAKFKGEVVSVLPMKSFLGNSLLLRWQTTLCSCSVGWKVLEQLLLVMERNDLCLPCNIFGEAKA